MTPRSTLGWSFASFATIATGLLSVCPAGIHAQYSSAVCLASFDWMDNSKSQNPCTVAAYLQASCAGGQFTVDPLPVDTHYTGPLAEQSNPCQCSSVTYNTISACGLCQGRTIINWSSWNFNCTTVYLDIFLPGIPDGTAVPQWAFQDVSTSDVFNATLAQAVGDNPESTASVARSTASALPTSTSISASITSSPLITPSNSSSPSSKTSTGVIAGGVVGGVVGAALIAGGVVYFIMKNKRSRAPPPAQSTDLPFPAHASPGFTNPVPVSPQTTQPRLYDPSDPSTFPTSPPPGTIVTGSSNNVQSSIGNYSTSVRPASVGYTGVAEI